MTQVRIMNVTASHMTLIEDEVMLFYPFKLRKGFLLSELELVVYGQCENTTAFIEDFRYASMTMSNSSRLKEMISRERLCLKSITFNNELQESSIKTCTLPFTIGKHLQMYHHLKTECMVKVVLNAKAWEKYSFVLRVHSTTIPSSL